MQNGAEVKESIWMEREEAESAIRSASDTLVRLVRLMNISAVTKRSDVGNNRVNFPIQTSRRIFSASMIIQMKFLHKFFDIRLEEHSFTFCFEILNAIYIVSRSLELIIKLKFIYKRKFFCYNTLYMCDSFDFK